MPDNTMQKSHEPGKRRTKSSAKPSELQMIIDSRKIYNDNVDLPQWDVESSSGGHYLYHGAFSFNSLMCRNLNFKGTEIILSASMQLSNRAISKSNHKIKETIPDMGQSRETSPEWGRTRDRAVGAGHFLISIGIWPISMQKQPGPEE